MRDPRDKVELSSNDASAQESDTRPFLSVHFNCCNVYLRVYRDLDKKGYTGRCPRCSRTIYFRIGEGGTDKRSFVVE